MTQSRAIQRLARDPRIMVTGSVPDVAEFVARAAVIVAPLRYGSGTRLKILEAMAMAKVVVATPLGCEGIEARPGEEIVVAEAPDDQVADAGRPAPGSGAPRSDRPARTGAASSGSTRGRELGPTCASSTAGSSILTSLRGGKREGPLLVECGDRGLHLRGLSRRAARPSPPRRAAARRHRLRSTRDDSHPGL